VSPNVNYLAGRRVEYARMKHYRKFLGHEVMRTAGSHGLFDLISIAPRGEVYFIQVKRVEKKTQAERLIRQFKERPPLGDRYGARYYQVMEVSVKELRGEVLSGTV
jgi:hypothetical protein